MEKKNVGSNVYFKGSYRLVELLEDIGPWKKHRSEEENHLACENICSNK
jgi:hypothetical protein